MTFPNILAHGYTSKGQIKKRDSGTTPSSGVVRQNDNEQMNKQGPDAPLDLEERFWITTALSALEHSLESSSGSSSGSSLEHSLQSWRYSDSSVSESSQSSSSIYYVNNLLNSIDTMESSQPSTVSVGVVDTVSVGVVRGMINDVCIHIKKRIEGIKQVMQEMKVRQKLLVLINKKRQQRQNVEGKKIQPVGEGRGPLSINGNRIQLAGRGRKKRGPGRLRLRL